VNEVVEGGAKEAGIRIVELCAHDFFGWWQRHAYPESRLANCAKPSKGTIPSSSVAEWRISPLSP
jgi:hypothetical protein